jgi:two-component system LytT family sensor kinase
LRILGHGGASVILAVAALGVIDLSDRLVHWSIWLGAPKSLISDLQYTVIHLHLGVAVYWVALGSVHAVRYHAEFRQKAVTASQLESQLARAQLHALRAQLHPHFLFNTLNSIAVLMRRDVESAETMLHRLSDLLRVTLDHSTALHVSLKQELDFLKRYLEIEQVRFQDRLTVAFDVDPAVLDTRVPYMLLQPLVENALRHGIAQRTTAGRLEVSVHPRGDLLRIQVRDDGPGMVVETADDSGDGIGLHNTRSRLEKLYGARHDFVLRNLAGGGLEVDLKIPLRAGVAASAEEGFDDDPRVDR